MTKTKNERLLSYLQNGNDITTRQAKSRFGISNLGAEVNRLRVAGHAVYCNRKTTTRGEAMTVYRIGTPRLSVVAAGVNAVGGPSAAFG